MEGKRWGKGKVSKVWVRNKFELGQIEKQEKQQKTKNKNRSLVVASEDL